MNHLTLNQLTKALLLKTTIRQLKGKIFSVDFIKANGKNRHMVCRTSVAKHVKGNTPVATAKRNDTLATNNMITVYEMKGKASQYRTLNLAAVKTFKCGQKEMMNFNDASGF